MGICENRGNFLDIPKLLLVDPKYIYGAIIELIAILVESGAATN